MKNQNPKFSVIIATYNYSSALKIALESVLDQTFSNFEVLVVGDACTDDSEAVVRSFKDDRLIWHNLPKNCGSQWGPNNYGLAFAQGDYIAYLGHDDLWWPTHLEIALSTFERTNPDLVVAASLVYGPLESGIRTVLGFFPNDIYTPRQVFPPSSMSHKRELARRIGGWRSNEDAIVATDYDFERRCYEAGARIVSTGEFTTFKFNTAWRRGAYRLRDPFEQRDYLARIRQEGEAFRRKELIDTLRAATEDKLHRIEVPLNANFKATENTAKWYDFKGSCKAQKTRPVINMDGRLRYPLQNDYAGFEWYGLEKHPVFGEFRWTGPSRRSTIILPAQVDHTLDITLSLLSWITEDILKTAQLSVNEINIETQIIPNTDGTCLWRGQIIPEQLPDNDRDEMRLTLTVDKTYRPFDLGRSDDRRWLGLAVSWVEI
ncbi:MAG: hypothetical protein BWK79_11210 [Beggiatoa sp. IS2]|nr:MAG: hypothetical protein BWK79_11210 [Beggiatoa sp. IS2]